MICPCHSGKMYEECCERYHSGDLCPDAESLMRSRYSAYALCLPEYIIDTTHPENPSWSTPADTWKKEILQFSQSTSFDGLKIESFEDGQSIAFVTFTAILMQGQHDVSFMERSQFVKIKGIWLYKDGVSRGVHVKRLLQKPEEYPFSG
jgi:SEC-C motif domain protein